ncbi:MAG: hypothetical protein AB7K24_17280 [Gemmataceae bacterium]
MTEKEWQLSNSPYEMIAALPERDQADERKLRLFGAAACRRHWERLMAFDFVDSVEVAEKFLEGEIDAPESHRLYDAFMEASVPALEASIGVAGWALLMQPFEDTAAETICDALVDLVLLHSGLERDGPGWEKAVRAENAAQADIVREVFGNPFHRPRVLRAWLDWRDGTVGKLAQAAYHERTLPDGLLEPVRSASWPMLSKKRAPQARRSWAICAAQPCTCAAAGR